MRKILVFGTVLVGVLAFALIGCQTAKPARMAPAASTVQAEESGFSPSGVPGHTAIDISLLYGNSDSIKAWTVEIMGSMGTPMAWTGDGGYLPASLTWDGKNAQGDMAPEGQYTARLSIEYAKNYEPATVESTSFVLDISPPTGQLTLDPPQLTPASQGVAAPMNIHIDARSGLAHMDSWSLDIFDLAGGLVKGFTGTWKSPSAIWDGSSLNGGFVTPSTTYKAVAIVRDEFGNSAQLKADIAVGDIPAATQTTTVQPQLAGFSPSSDTMPRAIGLALSIGNQDAIALWKLSVMDSGMTAQKSWTGDGGHVPASVAWDGSTDSGTTAPGGSYTAVLAVDYGNAFKPVLVKSKSFILDTASPLVSVVATPSKLAPDGSGGIQPVGFTLRADSGTAALDSWTLVIMDNSGATAASFNGAWPAAPVSWNGKLAGGGTAVPTDSFTYAATVRDVFGNVGQVRGSLAIGELVEVQGRVGIDPKSDGFSPNGDQVADVMSFALSFGQPSAVVSWSASIAKSGAAAIKTFTGDGSTLPATLTWDGKTDQGAMAPDGSYTATLSVGYGTAFKPATATSTPFVLDVTPPTGTLELSSPLFSPIEAADTITLALKASSPAAKIDSWTMDIYDPGGNVFRSFTGKWPANTATWDGKGTNGDMVQSAEDYPVVARIRDQFGNVGVVKGNVPIDILVEKTATGYRILSSRIFFKSFTADYRDVATDLAQQNATRLDALAAKLKKFAGYSIRIVGHAVMINWDNPAAGREEQKAILIPLSKARAAAVEAALVERGLDASRFTIEGVGAADQLVPDSNLKDRWQNRRVALYIEKN